MMAFVVKIIIIGVVISFANVTVSVEWEIELKRNVV